MHYRQIKYKIRSKIGKLEIKNGLAKLVMTNIKS